MRKRAFESLMRKAAVIAYKQSVVQKDLTAAFMERYGCTYSDVDADQLIDTFDYLGGAAPTLDEVDEIMTTAGAPPISRKARDDEQ